MTSTLVACWGESVRSMSDLNVVTSWSTKTTRDGSHSNLPEGNRIALIDLRKVSAL